MFLADAGQGLGIFGETGPAIAGASVQELVADAPVHAHALGDVLHIRPHAFAQRGDFVDEGDLGRKEGVGGVFDHLGRLEPRVDDREIAQEKRAIDVAHHLAGPFRFHPHNHPVGAHEIVDRRAFAQEFGVGGHVEVRVRIGGQHRLGHLAVGADGDGGFGDDHGIAGERAADFGGGGHDIGEVGMAIAATGRRADGDKDRVGPRHRLGQIKGKGQPPGGDILGHEVFQTWLEDRHFARPQPVDLGGVLVNADDLMAEIRKADPRNQADIAGANHRNLHLPVLIQCLLAAQACGGRVFFLCRQSVKTSQIPGDAMARPGNSRQAVTPCAARLQWRRRR